MLEAAVQPVEEKAAPRRLESKSLPEMKAKLDHRYR